MPKKIIIVRHGETEYNVERRLQGWIDIPLNKNGREQAKKVAERLKEEVIAAIYSSDHKRAHTTARHIANAIGIKAKKRTALRENRMGVLEGWQWEKEPNKYLEDIWNKHQFAYANTELDWRPEGGESIREVNNRIQKILDHIEQGHEDEAVVVVTHGGTINRILEIYGFKKPGDEYISFRNTSITILSKTATGYELELLNDITHLDSALG
jgi:probable phosphoglycerate mutase